MSLPFTFSFPSVSFQEMDLTAYALMVFETKKAEAWDDWVAITLSSLPASPNHTDQYVKVTRPSCTRSIDPLDHSKNQ